MLEKENIKKLVLDMSEDINDNRKKIKEVFGNLNYQDNTNQTLLHIFVDDKYDEQNCFLAIQTLLQSGVNPNAKDKWNYIFIQTALYTGYSEEFILAIITEACKYGLNVNHVDNDSDTIMHTAIYSDDYLGEINNIYELLVANGFDSSKRDHKRNNLIDALLDTEETEKRYTTEQIESFKKLYLEKVPKSTEPKKSATRQMNSKEYRSFDKLSAEEIAELEKCGKILNKKAYFSSPAVGREKEVKNLQITLAQEKKSALIVGESGVGKTAVVDELVYRIQNGLVPDFLLNRIIYEVTPNDVVAGCRYVGEFEESMNMVLEICEKYNVILFIDEIHDIYGTGSSTKKDVDMASILKRHLERTNLKMIGTTTEEEYKEYFSKDALKRRFEKVVVKEPTPEVLIQILNKVMDDYCLKKGIWFRDEQMKEQIISIIMELTKTNHRVHDDIVNNPDISIAIIDKAFAIATFYNSEYIEPNHFMESLEDIDRLSGWSKERAIPKLKSLNEEERPEKRTKIIDFTTRK